MGDLVPKEIVWDKAKGELRILGKRHTALDAQALCDHLDSLVGPTVAEVIMDNHERRLGKEEAEPQRHFCSPIGVGSCPHFSTTSSRQRMFHITKRRTC